MAGLFELKKQREEALASLEGILKATNAESRELTQEEMVKTADVERTLDALNPRIRALEQQNTIRDMVKNGRVGMDGSRAPGAFSAFGNSTLIRGAQAPMAVEYTNAFLAFLRSGGQQASSELS